MRIGILTHHYINNFGAFLQAYALCGAVAELYPDDEVEIINYINKRHFIINTLGWFRYYKNRESLESWMQKIRLPKTFGKARREDMKLSPLCLTVGDINKRNYDCIIVGSDEVWNYKDKKANQKVKFGYGLKCKKLIAYAPSVGKSDAGAELPDYVKEGVKKFDAVSARDSLTAELIEKSSGKKAARVLDPTFLYRFPKAELKSAKKPYILFYYCEHMPESIKNYILDYAKKHGFAVYGAGECDKVYTDITVNLSPFEWVEMFRNAEFVFTGTFHGAAMPYEEGRLVPKHIRIEKKEDIIKLQGSKYVQSDTGFTYSEAKNDLENGLYVLYSGTPCQITGLKNYLNKDYENLLTVEIICHGVPSAAFFNDFIENERKRRNVKEITSFSFRDKSRGQDMSSRLIMLDKNGNSKEKVICGKTSSYVSLFLKSLTYRENCYSCPYAVPERGADVTLGDFWGFHEEYPSKENTADLSNSKGISCMLINTEKGKRIVADIKDRLSIMESEFDKVACHNDRLRTPSKYNSLREHILELYKDKGYAAVEGYYRKKYRAERIGRSVIWILPKGLKRTMKQLKPKK